MVRVKPWVATCGGRVASVTCTWKGKVPGAGGVPLRTPVTSSVSQAGSVALADQEYGSVPPVALNVTEYFCPAVPAGKGDVVVIVSPVIASGRDCEADPP